MDTTTSNFIGGNTSRCSSRFTAGSDLLRRPVGRHFDGLTVAYCAGHAKWLRIDPRRLAL